MSQESSLTQSSHSVRQVLTSYTRLDARKNGQIGGIRPRSGPLERRKHCAAHLGFPGTPPSVIIVHAVPEFIWGMSAKIVSPRRRGRVAQGCSNDNSVDPPALCLPAIS